MCPAGISYPFYRLAASCGLLVIGTRLTLKETTLKLGTPSTGKGVGRVLQMMLEDPSWTQVSTALVRLADHLDTHDIPIDYERRGQLDYDALLPDELWIRSCRRLGRPARERNATVARAVLFERLSGLPADQAPSFVDTPDFRAALGTFPRYLDVELAYQAGVSEAVMQRWVHLQNIPLRRPGASALRGLRCRVNVGTLSAVLVVGCSRRPATQACARLPTGHP